MATTRTFTGAADTLDLRLPVGHAHVSVDPAAAGITVTLTTADDDGPSVAAIQDATASASNGRYAVRVPDIDAPVIADGASVVIAGRDSAVISIGAVYGNVVGLRINGNRITSGLSTAVAVSPIHATVTIPAGVGLEYQGTSADLSVTGHLVALDVTSVSGNVHLSTVGELTVNTTSGDVHADVALSRARVQSVSGDIRIGTYQGPRADLRTVSGDVRLSAGPDAHGSLRASTVSGDVRLRGTGRLDVAADTVSGRKSIA